MLPSISPVHGLGRVGSSGAYRGPTVAEAGSAVAMPNIYLVEDVCQAFTLSVNEEKDYTKEWYELKKKKKLVNKIMISSPLV